MEKKQDQERRRGSWPSTRWWVGALALVATLVTGCMSQARPTDSQPVPQLPPLSTPVEPSTPPPLPEPKPQPKPEPKPVPPKETPPPKADPTPPPAGKPSIQVVQGDKSCKRIAFTYDAGAGADGAAGILDTLKKHDVKATFFLTGKWVETFPDLAKRIAAEGHEIANHTYSHPDLTTLPHDEIVDQIKRGEESIRKITGQETKPLFREPYGAFSKAVFQAVGDAGFKYSIYWTLDTLDWQQPPVATIKERILTKAQNGSIILMHLGGLNTAAASDLAIPELRAKGYELTTVTGAMSSCK